MKRAVGGRRLHWRLTGTLSEGAPLETIPIDSSPFRIGREEGSSLVLPDPTVSNAHAEILISQDSLSLKDLNSTNGTYVNGERIRQTAALRPGDRLRFARMEFQVDRSGSDVEAAPDADCEPSPNPSSALSSDAPDEREVTLTQFGALLKTRAVTIHFQPIVSLSDRRVVACEALARGHLAQLSTQQEMFRTAARFGMEAELSRMLRAVAAESRMPERLFINTHWREIGTHELIESLRELRYQHGDQPIAIEIDEPASHVTGRLQELRDVLRELDIQLAYDHFGIGQTRRSELAALRPDYLKFDDQLIREIHLAPTAQRTLLANLVRMVLELGILPIATGVECAAEDATCRDMGFVLGQGFLYGKPAPRSESDAQ